MPNSLNIPAIWEVLIQEWSSQSGATTHFEPYDSSAANIEASFPKASSGGNFVLFPLKRICEIDKDLAPIGLKDGGLDARDIFKGVRERVLTRERQLIASPISVPVLVCYFRSDLLRASSRNHPETWSDYHELVTSVDSWAPGLVAVEPLHADFRATTFFARSLAYCKHPENYSVWFDVDSGKPMLDTPGFEKALEIAQQTWSKLPAEARNYSPEECRRQILSGKAAIALTFEPSDAGMTPHQQSETSAVNPRADGIEIGICRIPGSRTVYNRNSKKWDTLPAKAVHAPALCGFAGLAAGVTLPSNREQEAAANNLLASLNAASTFDTAFATLPKNPCHESHVAQAASWYGPDLSSDEASQYCDAVALSLRDTQLVFELPLVGADEFRSAASVALEPLLRGEMTPKLTLAAMQQSFEAIVERLGADSVRDSHRRGLGLSPRQKK